MNKLKYVLPGQRYHEFKTQKTYQVFQVGNHSETAQNQVVYVSTENRTIKSVLGLLFLRLASRLIDERVWVCPLELFEEKFVEGDPWTNS
jgi:hypothetical protein